MGEGGFEMDACLKRIRRGDEVAARQFMEQLYPLVLKIVRSHLPRRMSEEDLVQTIFMKVFTNLDRYAGQAPIEHWISRIAVNQCLNEIKAERVRPEWRWSDLSEEEQHVLESLASERENTTQSENIVARDLLEKLMGGLKPQERLVIQVLHLEERSVAEVAKMTGWSMPMVKVRAFRARQKLQKLLAQLDREEKI